MALHTCGTNFPFGYESDSCNSLDAFKQDFLAVGKVFVGGSSSTSQLLVLDNEKCELIKAPAVSRGVKKGGVFEKKALAALRSHSEAERRRRERINSHLANLRGLIPCTDKMDKATLLAEVICEVKELKKKAAEASRGLLIPMDADKVTVEPYEDALGNGSTHFKATICCEHHPEIFSDLRQAVGSLQLKIMKAEVSTLENRLKNVFVFRSCSEELGYDGNAHRALACTIHRALSSVATKASVSAEYSPTTTISGKRRRHSLFNSSSSSLIEGRRGMGTC